MKVYRDDFGNIANIDEVEIYPYKGAGKKQKSYRLTCAALYEDPLFIYHISVHETFADAFSKMQEFSGNTWKDTATK